MIAPVPRNARFGGLPVGKYARAIVLMALVACTSLATDGPVSAGMGDVNIAATQTASAGLTACNNNSGQALYGCVADVLDRLHRESWTKYANTETKRGLGRAAFQLRAATTKVQALSAISQCRAVLSEALQLAKTFGSDGKGLSAIAGVLAQAAKLIQTKG
jgi:hypothetical protein